MKMAYILIIITIIFFISPSFTYALVAGTPVVATNVHDGDTVSISIKSLFGIVIGTEKVRLIGIDAPEIKQEPWGRRAKKHLKKLINESGGSVHLEYDLDRRDKYGRILAYLWDKKGRMINQKMIEDGYATVLTIPPNVKYVKRFIEAQQMARKNKAGMWGKANPTAKISQNAMTISNSSLSACLGGRF